MKKLISILLVICVVLSFALFAMGSGSEEENINQGSGSAQSQEEAEKETVEGAEKEAGEANLGDYNLVIDSCRLARDFEGKPVVIVKYIYTNVSDDDATSFFMAFEDNVYQNGVGLNEAYFLDDDVEYNSDNQTKEIKKGASLEVEVAYELDDEVTDIEVEVSELISFNDKTVTKTFSIAE